MILSDIKQLKSITATNYQFIIVKCDVCGKEWKSALRNQQIGLNKYGKDLCRGCKQHEQIISGIRGKQYINAGKAASAKMIGKTYIELYGVEKALKMNSEHSKNISGEKNHNYHGSWHGNNPGINQKGKTLEEIHGIEKAVEIRKKLSKASSGENNPMYGKPSPQGLGNGWSGWYNDWFFRSLKELSYMIYVIERFNLKWESGEKSTYKIYYKDYTGNKRTYHPDFVIKDKYLVEIKPKHLWKSDSVKRKQEAAIQFCKKHNFIYKLTECPKLISYNEIKQLVNEKKLIFTNRYQEKFKLWKQMEN